GRAELRLQLLAVVADVDLPGDARILEVLDVPRIVDQVLARWHLAATLSQPDHVVSVAAAVGIGATQAFLRAGVFGRFEPDARVAAGGEDRPRIVQLQDEEADAQSRGERADQDGDLLSPRRGAAQVSG